MGCWVGSSRLTACSTAAGQSLRRTAIASSGPTKRKRRGNGAGYWAAASRASRNWRSAASSSPSLQAIQPRLPSAAAIYYGGVHAHEQRRIGWLANSRAPCSCWMCGNPRRYLGELTIQERRVLDHRGRSA